MGTAGRVRKMQESQTSALHTGSAIKNIAISLDQFSETRAGRVMLPGPIWLVLATCLALSYCGGVARAHYDTCRRAVGWDVERGTDNWELVACQPESIDLGRLSQVHVDPMDATCGHQRERFCNLENPYLCSSECDASTPELAHPPSLMFDFEGRGRSTYWQSASWYKHPDPFRVNITLSWNKTVELTEDVVLVFEFNQPSAMVLEKSLDNGRSWKPMQYYADDCRNAFNMDAWNTHALEQEEVTDVFCTEYYSRARTLGDSKVLRFEVTDRFALFSGQHHNNLASLYGQLDTNQNLREFFMLTDLRVCLLHPATGGTMVDTRNLNKYFYAISDMRLHGRCWCNLHAETCIVSDGHLMCNCQHHTEGPDCNRCAQGFRGSAWRSGSYLPYPVGTTNPCQSTEAVLKHCKCNGHSKRCSYIALLKAFVCIGCDHNTRGRHCQFCRQGFFHNSSLSMYHQHVCVACKCNPFGSSSNRCNQEGQCECKVGATGLRCDWCRPGYFRNRGCHRSEDEPDLTASTWLGVLGP
uniref:Netrin G1 n=1 Tax=Eptatretus burgeri TaxID=7764 RepID=A0A8C4Q5G8_EPTBU